MRVFTTPTDSKVTRIQRSWFQPAKAAAEWLAATADEVDLSGGRTWPGGDFVYVSLDCGDRNRRGRSLAVPANAFEEAVRRIPTLEAVRPTPVVLAA